ncbi:sterol regulatory element-binding protein cleavage-activating protein [Anoplophora glabripennis]|nr:sterol regulatory element-binding protein cleavage-activating protein [Anoplophora glabripennis]XP_018574714.1 sterol regulatory element-binding protein cleavage-activating protein [Anoplophora glabripennis]XP_018574715.1 sterol regulatory element-binding protein cleavage-activating protein [Anoplophora glabripennis]
MVLPDEQPRQRGAQGKSSTLQEKVGTFYYTLGLFCITYPVCVVLFAILVITAAWLPLVNLPFPGKAPEVFTTNLNGSDGLQPFCYVQQVVLRVGVLPWEPDLTLGDAFRAPLYEAFKLLEVVRNYQDKKSLKTLGHMCLHIEAIKISNKNDRQNVLPQYSCLVLSPANLWQQDVQRFSQDNSILTTIFNHHSFQKSKTSIAEMLFGMHLFDTGIKRYPIRNRQRIIQYAVTLFFKEYDQEFIVGLHEKLTTLYPLHQNSTKSPPSSADTVMIKYPGEINYLELVPICVSFILLFLYYYFSVRKIELIKSKLGMAFTATFTVFCSLTMTMGICFFFGLTLNFEEGKGIFPYLAILVGLENVLVLTKSVVSTPLHLDVKIRNAKGLSKEGWSITKNLLLEITVFTFGLFTFVPAIQEFCIFAIVGLITDFFLQMFFFLTILGVDISRMMNSAEKLNQNFRNGLYQTQNVFDKCKIRGMSRSKSHPRLSSFPANIVAGQAQGAQEKKIPKRVRLFNIWARTRFFQRSFMILMVIWISVIVYNSDIINHYILNVVLEDKHHNQSSSNMENYSSIKLFPLLNTSNSIQVNYVTYNPIDIKYQQDQSQDIDKLKHCEYAPWLKLSSRHWPAILKKYNMSLSGQTIAILPNIKLSHVVRPDQAVLLRNPEEKYGEKFQWHALAAALDPIDFRDAESAGNTIPQAEQPFYPTSPMEILLTTILCFISALVLAYTVVVLYRCICSRNYAEWRASWFAEKSDESGDDQVLLEALPVVLEGHQQEIECIATDGTNIVSACLGGQLKVWDNNTGELLTQVNRKSSFEDSKVHDSCLELDDNLSDYESGSPPSRDETFPRLLNKINTDFSHIKEVSPTTPSDSKYNFNKSFRHYYFNHDYDVKLKHSEKTLKRQSVSCAPSETNSEITSKRDSVSNGKVNFHRDSSSGSNFNATGFSPVWCMDYVDNLIVIGCADGRLEFWEGTTGKLKCIFEDGTDSGITNIKTVNAKVIAARLSGVLELFQLQTYNQGRPIDWNFTCAYKRTHVRTGSLGSVSDREIQNQTDCEEDLRCIKIISTRAHQQPVTCLDCEGGRVLTGSQDHTLKVFRLEDGSPLYTLHGHCGPITCLFMDRVSPATSGSGSQDGMLCVWDLQTGACMYNIQAHNGSITSLTYSASYVISLGTDERLCVWERFQGHLLNTIYVSQVFSIHVLMLAQHLVVTARSGGLVIWDVRTGECVRTITLGRSPFIFIKQLILLRDAVLCDYGKQLRIIRFPLITHKFD